jgi:hypothetical protein
MKVGGSNLVDGEFDGWMDGWMDRDFIVDEDGTSKSSACQIELRSRSQTSKLDFTKEW